MRWPRSCPESSGSRYPCCVRSVCLVLLLSAVVSSAACTLFPDDETLIARIVRSSVSAAQDRDVAGVLARVSDDFRGPQRASKDDIRRALLARLLRQQWLRIFERSLTVDVDGDSATAELRIVVARGNQVTRLEDLVPTNASLLRFQLTFERRSRRWWIVLADYQQEPLTLDALERP